ncbi:GumK N-terminal domain-containing glycosyltransferase [Roseivivax sp. CAU 1753]
MRHALLLSTHLPQSPKRASFHWIADALVADGWHVDFATVGLSRLSQLRGRPVPAHTGRRMVRPGLDHLFVWQALHPMRSGSAMLDAALGRLWRISSRKWVPVLADALSRADIVVVESGAPLALVGLVRRLAPGTEMIYRVNDDLRALRLPAWLQRNEQALARLCDRVSTASPYLARRFSHPNVTLDAMGVPRGALPHKGSIADPFEPRHPIEAICAGTSHMDLPWLMDWAQGHPTWRCHIVGHLRDRPEALPPNVVLHGERPYAQMLGYIAHADVGLAAYRDMPGVEYQRAHSNRIQLYRHYGLPVLGPDRLCHPSVPALIGYGQPDAAFRCETWTRKPERLPDWAELARALVQNGDTVPPFEVATLPARA